MSTQLSRHFDKRKNTKEDLLQDCICYYNMQWKYILSVCAMCGDPNVNIQLVSTCPHTQIQCLQWLGLLICQSLCLRPSQTNSNWTAHALANPTLWHLHLERFWFIKSSQHCGKFTFLKSPLERRLKWWSNAGQRENKSKLKGVHLSAQPYSQKPYCA